MKNLELLKSKLDTLIKKHKASEAENTRLKEVISAQNSSIEVLKNKIQTMEQSLTGVDLGRIDIVGQDKENMRAQLDNLINEIDKILTTLND